MPRLLPAAFVCAALTLAGCAGPRPASQPATPPAAAQPPARAQADFKPYREVVPERAATDAGLFTVHRLDDRLLLEIPDSLFGRDMLLISRIAQAPEDLHPYLSGGSAVNEQLVRWERRERQVLLRAGGYRYVAGDSLPVYQAVRNNTFAPVLEAFQIEALGPDSQSVVIDASGLFKEDVPALGLPSFFRKAFQVRRLDGKRSFLETARSFPRNVELRHVLTYEAQEPPSHERTNTLSLQMSQSMVLLPADPMPKRIYDPRVGWFTIAQVDFGQDVPKAAEQRYIRRWRLEPKDPAAYARGELVEPVQPIVFYLDPATPTRWRPYFKQGVEDWQRAFEAAGFKNAIVALEPPTPEENPAWSPEDVRYSTIRWVANMTRNAMGPSVTDPRTGEIIESDIIWYHNHMRSYRNRLLIETGAANPAIQSLDIPDEIIGETMRQVIAHEVGHALGLPHNMVASSAYPVDSLRSGTFTRAMGIAPTIMDYARQNYIAQPGDDVRYIRQIGPYDDYAINWGYRVIPGAATPEAEQPVLDAWIRAHADDPIYRFGTPGTDPRAQTEDLGDDNVRASRYALANLRRVVPQLVAWTSRPGEGYGDLEELYGELVGQWNRYVGHVAANVGGVYETRKATDQAGPVYEVVPEARQREAMAFLRAEVFETPTWLLDEALLRRIEAAGAVERMQQLQARWLKALLTPERMQRLVEADVFLEGDTYTLLELLDDVRAAVWTELAAGPPVDAYRRNLQRGYLEHMASLVGGPEAREQDADARGSDVQPFVRGQLTTLRGEVERALARTRDRATRYHLEDVLARIDHALDPAE